MSDSDGESGDGRPRKGRVEGRWSDSDWGSGDERWGWLVRGGAVD
jgi:hypothetical protein